MKKRLTQKIRERFYLALTCHFEQQIFSENGEMDNIHGQLSLRDGAYFTE